MFVLMNETSVFAEQYPTLLSIDKVRSVSCVGHVTPVALPRAVGRQPLRVGRAAVPDVPALPHVRALYALGVHPRARLLRAPRGLPSALPPR